MSTHLYTDLRSKNAIVTGGTRGIGFAIAEAMLQMGARVAVSGRKSDGVKLAIERLRHVGGDRVVGVAAHSARPEDVTRLFDEAVKAFGAIHVVVNNAATNPSMAPLHEVELEVFDKILETNLRGYLLVAREGVRRMREASVAGSIVNVSTVASLRPWPGLGAYSVSKAAVNSMTQVLAIELGRDGIRVNAIAPGVVRTRFSEALWKNPKTEEDTAKRLPLSRIAEPEDVVGAALFLASEASRYVTGQVLVVDGGMMLV